MPLLSNSILIFIQVKSTFILLSSSLLVIAITSYYDCILCWVRSSKYDSTTGYSGLSDIYCKVSSKSSCLIRDFDKITLSY